MPEQAIVLPLVSKVNVKIKQCQDLYQQREKSLLARGRLQLVIIIKAIISISV